jgi:two-component system response regulator PilR (NtrC family)
MAKLLIVDDDLSLREFLSIFLRKEGHEVEVAANGLKALELLAESPFDLVLTDVRMPRMGGFDLLDAVRERQLGPQVIVMTAFSSTETALEAMRKGAYDYVVKPFQLAEVKVVIQKCLEKSQLIRENQQLKSKLADHDRKRPQLIFRSPAMAQVQGLVQRVARTPSSVLVVGESGTGKEVVARMLHAASDRANKPFVAINCGAIPEQLMESELFGHLKGSFTGASKDKKGLFEAAHGGTLFLDEIAELTLGLQVKLLRVLQERVVTPVGDTREVAVDVRVVAATHQNLRERVQQGSFRADLYFRLNVIEVRIPPLRERRDDILPLAEHFLARFNRRMNLDLRGFDADAEAVLVGLPYPGNVRELENIVERAVALETGERITPANLPDPGSVALWSTPAATVGGAQPNHDEGTLEPAEWVARAVLGLERWLARPNATLELEPLLTQLETGVLDAALRQARGNKTEAARLVGLSFRSLRYKLVKHGGEESEG